VLLGERGGGGEQEQDEAGEYFLHSVCCLLRDTSIIYGCVVSRRLISSCYK
jgi:hypothetical protein